ncbi:Dcp1p-Dcp2p decapping enzyme complex alpha subunit [Coemansia javaensis]|uniref:mRNA guanylyltransferase n=1 Tax=Coemansia javaensis TaxID=2761396 RepID=A0A9W8H932_9FUNG|nr:Dcp1p-Dcp2p decapping enzyme complex alpha subunit [Coemansia javaensis]
MAGDIPSIPGVEVPKYAAFGLRRVLADVLGLGRQSFPGSQPVSFTARQSMAQLMSEDYLVCEKSDGVRVLLVLLADRGSGGAPLTYVVTRKNEYFLVPGAPFPSLDGGFHDGTVVDAELVVDVEPDGRRVRRLLGFDTLAVGRTVVMARPLTERLDLLRTQVFEPFAQMRRALSPAQAAELPFEAEVKTFRPSYEAAVIQHQVIPHLLHQNDGLIFTSVDAPYVPGTCDKIIKWKPACENSVDFRARLMPDGRSVMLSIWRGRDDYVDHELLAARDEDWPLLLPAGGPPIDGRVIEAAYDPAYAPPARWRFLRFRDDKEHGNHSSVVTKIIESINDSMELDRLLAAMGEVKLSWMRRHPHHHMA